jgi:hypothetical protein
MNSKQILKSFLIFLITIHFSLILIGQGEDQGWLMFKNKTVENINNNYINPYFEQGWGMFAPNPPIGNEYMVLQFSNKHYRSDFINIHELVKQNSLNNFFSIDQRLIKYLDECNSDILSKKFDFTDNKKLLEKSYGLKSILNYSKIVLSKQKKFLKNTFVNDTIKVDVYIIYEPFN